MNIIMNQASRTTAFSRKQQSRGVYLSVIVTTPRNPMSKIILFCSLFFIISAAEAADVKLAIVDVSEVEELIKIKVMAMPENAEAKAKIAELNNYPFFKSSFPRYPKICSLKRVKK
jgi:hypothetical protein